MFPLVIHCSEKDYFTSLSPRWLRNTSIQINFHCVFLIILKISYFGLQLSPGFIYWFFVCSRSSAAANAASGEFFKHLCFVLVSVFSELEFAQWQSQGFWYIILLMASLVPEALPALSQPVVFPPSHFTLLQSECFLKVKGIHVIFRSQWVLVELLSHPLTLRPKNAWVERQKCL